MTGTVTVLVVAALLAVIISAVRRAEPGIGGVISVSVTVWLCFVAGAYAVCFKDGLSDITDGRISEILPYLLKSAGIGFLTATVSDICTDLGERSIASAVMTAGKLGILTVCLPLIRKILDTATGYINGQV